MNSPIPRVGGRLLLVSPAGRLLLIHERIEVGTHWLTPGGGVEAGEPPVVAAVREVHEETGLRLDLPADARSVLTTRRLWSWQGREYDQVDHFFLARVAEFDPAPAYLTEMEQQTLLGHRWWSVADLRASGERFLPADIADVLERVLTEVTSERS